MKTSKLLAAFASTLLAATALAGCGDGSSEAAGESGNTKVRLAFTPGATTLPVYLALTQGFFEDHGLDVEDTQGLDLPTWMAGLGKQWDVAMETPGVYVAGANKLDLVVLAGGQVTTADELVNPLITFDPDIKEPIDLVGKKIGVQTLTGSTPTSLEYVITQEGGDFSEVTLVQMSSDQMGDQLRAGGVDAVVSSIPFAEVILQDPNARDLFDAQDVGLRLVAPDQEVMASVVYTSTRAWAEENPDAAMAFRDALQEATEWMDANEKAAKDVMVEWLNIPEDVAQLVKWPIPVQAEITAENLQPAIDLAVKAGKLSEADAPDLSDRFPNDG